MAYLSNFIAHPQDGDFRSKNQHENQTEEKDAKSMPSTMQLIEADLSGTKYPVIYKAAEYSGFYPNNEQNASTFLIWNDAFISAERVAELKAYQKINHFPAMSEISRKDTLARNMSKLAKAYPEEYDFVPKTWILPTDLSSLISYYREIKTAKKTKFFIVKPANGAQGHGIWLTKNLDRFLPSPNNQERQFDGYIVQEYIDKPFLIDGFKCDLRIYVLVVSCDPLRIFLYSDGLLRFATEVYRPPSEDNCNKLFMHLTNYAVNKNNASFDRGDSAGFHGSKRSLRFLTSYLRKHDIDVAHLWRRITDMVIKTLIAAEPHLLLAYRSCRPGHTVLAESVCFELLGLDILLDERLKPWLLEVNRSPSFATDTEIDKKLKFQLMKDTFSLLNIRLSDRVTSATIDKTESQRRLLRPSRRSENDLSALLSHHTEVEELETMLYRIRLDAAREDYENRHCGFYRRVFPPPDMFSKERFGKLLLGACSTLLPTRSAMLLREIEQTYLHAPREEEIFDRLSSLNGMNASNDDTNNPEHAQLYNLLVQKFADLEEDPIVPEHDTEESDTRKAKKTRVAAPTKLSANGRSASNGGSSFLTSGASTARNESIVIRSANEPVPPMRLQRSARVQRDTASAQLTSSTSAPVIMNCGTEADEKLTAACLECLRSLHIRFPGKSEAETDSVLLEVAENWSEFRAPIATYWLVRLDHARRRRLLDIVKSNVWAVIQQIWNTEQAEQLQIGRTLQRLFNRLLWNNGQGLWNTFSVFNRSNWEAIFSYSTYPVSQTELDCCRRVVQLCRDCLLIVYKFAEEARASNHRTNNGITAVNASNKQSGLSTSVPSAGASRHLPTPTRPSSRSPKTSTPHTPSFHPAAVTTRDHPLKLNITGGAGHNSVLPLTHAL